MELRRFATKRTLTIAAVAVALAVGAGVGLAATAGAFDPKAEQDAFEAAVAKKLGVTQQELEDAYKAAALERIDAAVEAGRLTKDQADELKKRIDAGDFMGPFFGPRAWLGRPMHDLGHPGSLDAAADYLGLTEAQLFERLVPGQSLAEIAKAEGKSVDGLKNAMVDAAKKRLDQAVEDGRLTAAQRDAILDGLEARIDEVINRAGRRGPGHRPFGFPAFERPPNA